MNGIFYLFIPGATVPEAAGIQLALIEKYQSAGRAWHTLRHIYQMLDFVSGFGPTRFRRLQLAIWFHDAVYFPGAEENEEWSAKYMRSQLEKFLPESDLKLIEAMIMATKHGQEPEAIPNFPTDSLDRADAYLLLDADLSVLAATPQEYEFYRRAIMHEAIHLALLGPDKEIQFYTRRNAFLKGMLEKPKLFRIVEQLEAPARANMKREVEENEMRLSGKL